MSDNVVPFHGGLSRAAAERRIRAAAVDTAVLVFPWSVAKQAAAAGIAMREVIALLRTGSVVENPARNERGDWMCVLRKKLGGRNVEAVVALSAERPLTVVEVR